MAATGARDGAGTASADGGDPAGRLPAGARAGRVLRLVRGVLVGTLALIVCLVAAVPEPAPAGASG
jgi:hypothetical protein